MVQLIAEVHGGGGPGAGDIGPTARNPGDDAGGSVNAADEIVVGERLPGDVQDEHVAGAVHGQAVRIAEGGCGGRPPVAGRDGDVAHPCCARIGFSGDGVDNARGDVHLADAGAFGDVNIARTVNRDVRRGTAEPRARGRATVAAQAQYGEWVEAAHTREIRDDAVGQVHLAYPVVVNFRQVKHMAGAVHRQTNDGAE